MKGIEGYIMAIVVSVVLLVIAIIVIWLVMTGYLKFGTTLTNLTLKGVKCGICKGIPWGINQIFCGGC